MEYEEFKKHVVTYVKKELQEDERVEIHHVTKNNALQLDGLMVMREGSNAAPVLYLNDFYKEYCKGCSLGSIVGEITNFYQYGRSFGDDLDISFYKDFKSVKDHLYYKLVNYEKNKEELANMPHVRTLDLALVFYCRMHHEKMGIILVQIYNSHLKLWNVSDTELYRLARKNTEKDLPPEIVTMDEIVEEAMRQDPADLMREDRHMSDRDNDMYVLTNYLRQYGAAAMMYQGVLARFAMTIGSDFYIIPSSVHEVILLPAHHTLEKKQLEALVREVNRTQVEEEEVLSDNVYFYSKTMRKILY